jgi:hypothetical protein
MNSRIVVRCTRACLGLARSQRTRLVLPLVAPCVLALRDLSQMWKYETLGKCNAWGAKSGILYAHAQLIHINPYKSLTNLPIAFLIF